jgi:hypothetical protein
VKEQSRSSTRTKYPKARVTGEVICDTELETHLYRGRLWPVGGYGTFGRMASATPIC